MKLFKVYDPAPTHNWNYDMCQYEGHTIVLNEDERCMNLHRKYFGQRSDDEPPMGEYVLPSYELVNSDEATVAFDNEGIEIPGVIIIPFDGCSVDEEDEVHHLEYEDNGIIVVIDDGCDKINKPIYDCGFSSAIMFDLKNPELEGIFVELPFKPLLIGDLVEAGKVLRKITKTIYGGYVAVDEDGNMYKANKTKAI